MGIGHGIVWNWMAWAGIEDDIVWWRTRSWQGEACQVLDRVSSSLLMPEQSGGERLQDWYSLLRRLPEGGLAAGANQD